MKIYLVSLSVGILVGIIYAFLHVRSPAPPAIALIGLLGMLIGEQIVPTAQRLLAGEPLTMVWFKSECIPKITGAPPASAENETGTGTASADDSGARKS
ncbi:MAG TPA: XapX domain-containing protein [Herbaspirillum sp.]|jgi:XapX domain-containing protein